ncbi:MAG: HAD hydrolase family protein [Armatimonadetes bacterium]|nr:HAD hydrolase family protein [Armatimonadota bacterium]
MAGRCAWPSPADALALGNPLRVLVPRDLDAVQDWLAAHHPGRFSLTEVDNPDYTERWGILLAVGADKGSALEAIGSRLGVPREERLAIGDDLVDQAMFAHAGLAVAMGNAREVVRAAADHVAPSHDEEGVAWAVERYVV